MNIERMNRMTYLEKLFIEDPDCEGLTPYELPCPDAYPWVKKNALKCDGDCERCWNMDYLHFIE